MTFCEFCGEQISYLPFTCKYCGGTYCKKHRLPENHECTFELKHVPVVPTTQKEAEKGYQDIPMKRTISKVYLEKEPRKLKKYLKRQERETEKTLRGYQRSYERRSQYQGTKILFFTIIIFSITALIFEYFYIPEYFYLSLHGLVYKFTYYTLFTSLFVSSGDIISLFFLFIILFVLYFMARNIEVNQGTKFLVKLYMISTLFTAIFYILLRILLMPLYSLDSNNLFIGLAWGGVLGILSYSLFPIMNRKITALMYFLPIRMSGRSLLLIIVLFRLIPVILFAWYAPYYIVFYLPELGGILGSYIVYRYKFLNK